ncbi:hypothetical protein M595_2953 [Lyngbya aestuarii BL J]|uniref:Uncharacterized protein n=1 Tax=Lyngbya aestuarii BL J TaxID=1348334 RepID=U7QIK0_9CYAN|nr:hypothetical protein [Lyngbya aestuarii]ERT07102.1 hypothetical protein M595_2953 [Lyngbya aestuarii BL J]
MLQHFQVTSEPFSELHPISISEKNTEILLESDSSQASKSNQSRWIRYRFSTILLACLILWTPILTWHTIEVQHSCHPLVNWSNQTAKECTPPIDRGNQKDRNIISGKPNTAWDSQQTTDTSKSVKKDPTQQTKEHPKPEILSPIEQAKEHRDLAGATAGIAAGAVAAIASAPAAVAVGVGVLFWLVIRSALSR